MALLAIQERTARAATRDQHLLTGAHPAVAETVSTIQVLDGLLAPNTKERERLPPLKHH
jgi:hypothetical protein